MSPRDSRACPEPVEGLIPGYYGTLLDSARRIAFCRSADGVDARGERVDACGKRRDLGSERACLGVAHRKPRFVADVARKALAEALRSVAGKRKEAPAEVGHLLARHPTERLGAYLFDEPRQRQRELRERCVERGIALGRDELVPTLGLREQARQPQWRNRQCEVWRCLAMEEPAIRGDGGRTARRP